MQNVVMTDPRKSDYFYEEAIKTLRTNIQFSGIDIKTIVVTSCYPNEGKSDVTFQLALEIGKMGKKVLVVDADIRKSAYVSRYQIKERISGLSQYLSGQRREADIIYRTNFEGVDMIFAGPTAPNPSELLEQESFSQLLGSLREKYDYVLIDTPPIANLIDAAIAAKQCDGAILVIESGTVSRRTALKAKEQLEMTGCRLLGAVLNKVDVRKDKYYSKYSYYYKNDRK
ncbi:MAG TPA: CpsD/CapB family tyrosine-protein kinase [Candidatus Mediterraneibacter excrementavium]|nr:CpsD/CapB family tyrosine-protein kinase [Candidatus Mediterraneibacter excrementavium]